MSNEKFPVFCPYCGAKMLLKNEIFNLQATDGNRARYWYRCRNEGCESESPGEEHGRRSLQSGYGTLARAESCADAGRIANVYRLRLV